MAKYDWKVRAVSQRDGLIAMAKELEKELNDLEKEGFEIQKLEIKNQGVLLTGRRPTRRTG
jgi:hypothetical protein